MSIVAFAESLIAEATARQQKTAAAPATVAAPSHPVAVLLKEAAAILRTIPDDDEITVADVAKLAAAMQPGTGAQSPGAGAGAGGNMPAPTLPSLRTTNLGVTAGTGGAAPTAKIASEIRKLATALRESDQALTQENQKKAAHVLNAARGLHYLREGLAQ